MNIAPSLPAHSLDIQSILESSSIPELRRLVIETTDHEVILTGRVSSYYIKQMAQEAVRGCLGNRKIINRVYVVR